MVWCKSTIKYNVQAAIEKPAAVVVWCKSTIKYNGADYQIKFDSVVVWCKSTIKYNLSAEDVIITELWFGVRVL